MEYLQHKHNSHMIFIYSLFASFITCHPLIYLFTWGTDLRRDLKQNLSTGYEFVSLIFHQAKLFGHTSVCWFGQLVLTKKMSYLITTHIYCVDCIKHGLSLWSVTQRFLAVVKLNGQCLAPPNSWPIQKTAKTGGQTASGQPLVTQSGHTPYFT